MAYTIREAAKWLREDAQDGISWIALWKDGRGWGFNTFYLNVNKDGTVVLDYPEDLENLHEILANDPNAIMVNGYYCNLAVDDGHVTRDDLARALRWQYDLQSNTLADFVDRIVQPAQEPAADAEQVTPADLEEMHKNEETGEDEDVGTWRRQERAVTLTNVQWSRLVCYLLQSTKFREGERDAWLSLAEEKNPDGTAKFPNAARNAEYWQEVIEGLNDMMPKLDGLGLGG